MNIGERIKQRRIELGWSQRDLAEKMNYSNHSTVGKIETGKVDIPQSRIVQFAEVLGVTVAHLMNWEEDQKKNDIQSDIILKMRSNVDFLQAVETLYRLDDEKLKGINQMLNTLFK